MISFKYNGVFVQTPDDYRLDMGKLDNLAYFTKQYTTLIPNTQGIINFTDETVTIQDTGCEKSIAISFAETDRKVEYDDTLRTVYRGLYMYIKTFEEGK